MDTNEPNVLLEALKTSDVFTPFPFVYRNHDIFDEHILRAVIQVTLFM